ncbi:hypothetical protein DM02DRAFT_2999 [Periconia macrospinosa]|uniref:Uncharacterized protein n=1 Tax=Periconia macrospinosa TaxID=97972 RepID=A0A2V1EED4_9PLEO|nr:hypothetical protein DM02DRAFT_2999 [Periconia macrospinosa]
MSGPIPFHLSCPLPAALSLLRVPVHLSSATLTTVPPLLGNTYRIAVGRTNPPPPTMPLAACEITHGQKQKKIDSHTLISALTTDYIVCVGR